MTLQKLSTYNPDQLALTIAGNIIQGFGETTMVRIERAAPDFTTKVGADGETTRSKTSNHLATCTIVLMQTSDSNDLLSALRDSDLNDPNGAGIGAFRLEDFSGRAVYTAEKCWVSAPPNPEFARESGEREWTIEIAHLKQQDLGNA